MCSTVVSSEVTRSRIGYGLLFVMLSLLCSAPEASAQLRIRKNYRDLTAAQRQKFRDALVAIKAITTDTGYLGVCTALSANAGRVCDEDADCDPIPVAGRCSKICEGTMPPTTCNGAADCAVGVTCKYLCEWTNKYDKYVCWHAECG